MKFLAIDTSGRALTLAAVNGEEKAVPLLGQIHLLK